MVLTKRSARFPNVTRIESSRIIRVNAMQAADCHRRVCPARVVKGPDGERMLRLSVSKKRDRENSLPPAPRVPDADIALSYREGISS